MTTLTAAPIDLTGLTTDDRHHVIARISQAAHAMRATVLTAADREEHRGAERRRFHAMCVIARHIGDGDPEIPADAVRALDTDQRDALTAVLRSL